MELCLTRLSPTGPLGDRAVVLKQRPTEIDLASVGIQLNVARWLEVSHHQATVVGRCSWSGIDMPGVTGFAAANERVDMIRLITRRPPAASELLRHR
jgi:hypothetical protein